MGPSYSLFYREPVHLVRGEGVWLFDAQGRRYGQRLHEAMVDWLREQSAPTLWLTTGQHTRATVFYERLGWRRVGVSSNGEARYELPD